MTQRVQPSLTLNGVEVLNGYRTWRYVNLLAVPGLNAAAEGCICPALLRDLGSPTFVSPAADPAPWYDGTASAADFLGAILTDVEGLDASMVTRGDEELAGDGARLARQRTGPFRLTFRAWLVARTDDGMAYGRLWLANRLASCAACDVSSATVRLACPPDNGSDDTRAKYTVYGLGLTAGLAPTDRPEVVECPYLLSVEWEMVAEDGYLYTDPVASLASRILVPQDWTDAAGVDTIASGLWAQSGGVTIAGGTYVPVVAAANTLTRQGVAAAGDRTQWRNADLTVKHRTGTSIASYSIGLAGRIQAALTTGETSLIATVRQATSDLVLFSARYQGTELVQAAAPTALVTGLVISTDYWLRMVMRDEVVVVEHWLSDPQLGGAPNTTATVSLDANLAAMHAQGQVGVRSWAPIQAAARADDFRVEELAGPAVEFMGATTVAPDWLGDAAAVVPVPTHCAALAVVNAGERGAVVTITAGALRDVTDVVIHADPSSYPSDEAYPSQYDYPMAGTGLPELPFDGSAPLGILVRRVPAGATLVVDTARGAATLTQNGLVTDGGYLVGALDGGAFGWPRADWCAASRVCVSPLSYGSDDGTALVTVQTRTRQR